jgi:hypothetical protein
MIDMSHRSRTVLTLAVSVSSLNEAPLPLVRADASALIAGRKQIEPLSSMSML